MIRLQKHREFHLKRKSDGGGLHRIDLRKYRRHSKLPSGGSKALIWLILLFLLVIILIRFLSSVGR